MTMVMGIDPGLTGGIVVLGIEDEVIEKQVMPIKEKFIDLEKLRQLLIIYKEFGIKIYLEKVHSMPKQGVASSFKFGRIFGAIEAMLAGLQMEYFLVTPQEWQKVIHKDMDRKKIPNPKDRSYLACMNLFPTINLCATPRCRKPHKGLIDALLIAKYGKIKEGGK